MPYVEAFCLQRQAVRCFMISRIVILDGAEVAPKCRHGPVVGPIPCEIEVVELEGDYGSVDGIEAICSRCGHVTESCGTGTNSIRRCLALMREECPRGESNYYVEVRRDVRRGAGNYSNTADFFEFMLVM